MVGCTSHIHRAASSHVAKQCGRNPKTSLPELGSSSKRSPGVSSNDWRRKAAAMSSPRRAAKRSDQSYNADDNIDIQLNYEQDTSFSGPQYRYPTTKRARWESVLSAPTWQEPSTSSSVSEDDPREVTRVQLKHVNPIFTTINGEEVPLPNRFTLDISVVRPDDKSFGPALAELKPTNGRSVLRPISSDNSDHILVELQNMISSDRASRGSALSASSEAQDARLCSQHARSQGIHECSSGSAVTGRSFATSEPSDAQTEPPSEEEARFNRMLSRLQKSRQPSPPAQETVRSNALPSRRPVDPAIMASKVASKTEASETSTRDDLNKEAANHFFAQQLDDMRNTAQQNSSDSGYASKDNERQSGDISEPDSRNGAQLVRLESSNDEGQLKTLNPAAAEFKSTTNNESTPWLAPKKLSRQPITNIFPNAMATHLPLPNAAVLEGDVSQQVPRTGVSAGLPAQTANDTSLGRSSWPTAQTVMAPGELRTGNTLSGQVASPMGMGSMMAPTMPTGSPMFPPLASLASAGPSLNTSVSGPPMGLPVLNGFNTFPPAPGTHMPIFNPGAVPGLNQCLAAPTPFNTAPLAPQSMLMPGGKPTRPYFPVTTKPRDRDPVKQQMYEAYLEWRKANEPGYHMKCKIRQAQRVRSIAEKAKAAVGAAAAAAQAAKQQQQESVREELRNKVKELSRESQKAVGEVQV
ncbi:hypothetical protein C8A05DRAFT_37877 [Staphylotrichum tortipilum]|uniref:Uncharacterized protein n=1 Tax=Staphylotrichum tortipilum TaxID=2831512 RepID=A0AAN6MED4_9PEZI|nr:hypothetical protein C8A05DRAFT_37877 [Staphylotrichum longicolle]